MSEKVDVVYTLAHKSKHRDDWELRYSLRSLAQQPWVGNVYLVGHRPAWARGVVHVPCGDPHVNKDANIIRKVLKACTLPEVSERFVVNSDDHYVLEPIPLSGLGPWLENPSQLPESYQLARSSTWHRRLVDTVAWCRANRRPTWVWECHIPYLVEKATYRTLMPRVPYRRRNGLVTHVYYNLTVQAEPMEAPLTLTTRLKEEVAADELADRVRGRTFFNHNNDGLCEAVQAWMETRFPNPSPWEA